MANYRPQPNWRDHYNPLRGLTMARIVAMEEAAAHLAAGMFTGFSILEKVRTGYGPLVGRLDHLPPWYWVYDTKGKRWYFNPESKPGTHHGQPVDERDLVIFHPCDPLFKSIGRHGYGILFEAQYREAALDWPLGLAFNGK